MVITERFRTIVQQILTEFSTRMGDFNGALSELERSVTAGLFDITWLDRCPALEPLRDHSRFQVAHEIVEARARRVRDALGIER